MAINGEKGGGKDIKSRSNVYIWHYIYILTCILLYTYIDKNAQKRGNGTKMVAKRGAKSEEYRGMTTKMEMTAA